MISEKEKDALVEDIHFLINIPPYPCDSCFVRHSCEDSCPTHIRWNEKYGKKVLEKNLDKTLRNIFKIRKIYKEADKLQKELDEICETDSLINALLLYYEQEEIND